MRHITLNGTVRSYLNRTGKPIHYYPGCLKYTADCINELLFDTLKITNTVRLSVNEFFEAEIPADFVDKIFVGLQVGQLLRPLVQKSSINRLPNFDNDGNQINYSGTAQDVLELLGSVQLAGMNYNTNGENTGGYFGLGAGSEPDTYEIIEERDVIQLNRNIPNSKIVLEYIGDGTFVNAASRITPYAQKTIESYIDWQYKENSLTYGAMDAARAKQQFDIEHGKLRSRLSDLTPELLHRIMNRHRKATIK